ncbi:MAG: OadG family protein [Alkalispirochaeta sp.]
MNVESFSYVLLTTVVGMAIVFLFLAVLSLLMFLIRFMFDEKTGAGGGARPKNGAAVARNGGGAGGHGGESTPSDAADRSDDGVPRWVVAAALAYLSEEEREYAPRASGWTVRSMR